MIKRNENPDKYIFDFFRPASLYLFIIILSLFSNIPVISQTTNLNYYIERATKINQTISENQKLLTTYNTRKELINSSLGKPKIFSTVNYLFAPTFGEYGYDSSITNGGLFRTCKP